MRYHHNKQLSLYQGVLVVFILLEHYLVCCKPVMACINPIDGSPLHVEESYHERCNLCTCKVNGDITCTNRTCKRRRGMLATERGKRNVDLYSEYEFFLLLP